MSKLKTLLLSVVLMAGTAALSACETAPDSEKDYTLKTVKWSPAPRDKFYRVVKVPKKQIVATDCETRIPDTPVCRK